MANLQGQESLSRIFRIVEAGEKGFATAAVNMPTQGMKILLKHFAQQRANYKIEILAELQRLGQNGRPWSSIPGMIHRGRLAIFAALTEKDEREKTILDEIVLGEKIAMKAFEQVLEGPLPDNTRKMLARQLEEIVEVRKQIDLLRGQAGKHLVVNLYDNETEAGLAIRTMQEKGLPIEVIQKFDLREAELYPGRGATFFETILAGAVGGALWGGLAGILVGFGVTQTVTPAPLGMPEILGLWVPAGLATLLVGALLSAGLAFFIGISISEEDTFLFNDILGHNLVLLETVVNQT
jgi:uncharacterized protein (TIGR02284 family)